MRSLEQLHLESVLGGYPLRVERIEYARELRRVADLNSPYTHSVTYAEGYFVVARATFDLGSPPKVRRPIPFVPARVTAERRSGEDRRAPRNLYAEDQARSVRQSDTSGDPCEDCTQESAVYRAIPVDEATLEYVFLKSRKFLGGATLDELEELLQQALEENEGLDYAEVFWVRERHKFELGAGDRLRTRRQS